MGDGDRLKLGYVTPGRKSPEELKRVRRRAEIDLDAINRIEATRTQLEHLAYLLERAVKDAIEEQGYTWDQVGEALGIAKQSAWKRFSHRIKG